MSVKIRVALVDDHDAFVEGLGIVLAAEEDLEVVAMERDGTGALRALIRHRPDVLVVDAHLPGTDVEELLRAARELPADIRVLVLSADSRRETISQLLQAGADGFVSKEITGRQLAHAIRRLVQGQNVLVSHGTFAPDTKLNQEFELLLGSLSRRERQVLGLLALGYTNRRIADAYYLSLNTVRTHVQNILVKLGVHSKLEAAALAVRHGIVGPPMDPADVGLRPSG